MYICNLTGKTFNVEEKTNIVKVLIYLG